MLKHLLKLHWAQKTCPHVIMWTSLVASPENNTHRQSPTESGQVRPGPVSLSDRMDFSLGLAFPRRPVPPCSAQIVHPYQTGKAGDGADKKLHGAQIQRDNRIQ